MKDQGREKINRADRDLITSIIPRGATVLDLGCGDGSLLFELINRKNVMGRGIDIDENNFIKCIEKGLSVCMSNLDDGLADYPDASYDYVILNQTLQVINKPARIIREMLRVGRHAIVGFPNFGHLWLRWRFLVDGKMPRSKVLPFDWHSTPNIHNLTIRDFMAFCRDENISIMHDQYLMGGSWRHGAVWKPLANLFAVNGMFILRGEKERM